MYFIRFITVIISCLCFTSAAYASVTMPCCMEKADEMQMQESMPCHTDGVGEMAKQSPKTPMQIELCKCVCTLHQAVLQEQESLSVLALNTSEKSFMRLRLMEFKFPIENPPRPYS